MTYKFALSGGRNFIIELPYPIETMGKIEKKQFIKEAIEYIESLEIKSKIEAMAKYHALLEEAQELKEKYKLD